MHHEKTKQNKPEWKKLLSQSISKPSGFPMFSGEEKKSLKDVVLRYPMRINTYYLGLIKEKDDPIYRQCVPDMEEIVNSDGYEDPLSEEEYSPTRGITHRYPDRVLFLISGQCAVYCRFCNRKRKVGKRGMVTAETIKNGIEYIRNHGEIRDVLLSGGDPLLCDNQQLDNIIGEIRSIRHVEIIRIGTRVPCTLPHRVTPRLTGILKKYHPLYIHIQFNHPREITKEASTACGLLANAGLPLGCQTVLLQNVNDNPRVMKELMQKLLTIRVRPYYLFQADRARGTAHFWTPLERGLHIMRALHGHTSGLCIPHFAVDLPGGGGKIPFSPQYVDRVEGNELIIKNFEKKIYRYPLASE